MTDSYASSPTDCRVLDSGEPHQRALDCVKVTSDNITEIMAMTTATTPEELTSNRVIGLVISDSVWSKTFIRAIRVWLSSTFRMASHTDEADS